VFKESKHTKSEEEKLAKEISNPRRNRKGKHGYCLFLPCYPNKLATWGEARGPLRCQRKNKLQEPGLFPQQFSRFTSFIVKIPP